MLVEEEARLSKACVYGGREANCPLIFEGRVIWEGSPRLVGQIEPEQRLELTGIELSEQT